jgi:hypothetical protein
MIKLTTVKLGEGMSLPISKLRTDEEIIISRMRHFKETREQAEKYIKDYRSAMASYLLTIAVKRCYRRMLEILSTGEVKK